MGQFTATGEKRMPYSEVQARNIISFFSDANQKNANDKQDWWVKNVKGKKIEIRDPATQKTIIADPLDTCGNYDCKGCCSKNAAKGSGTLIDMEVNTSTRFWGKPRNGKVEWRWVTGDASPVVQTPYTSSDGVNPAPVDTSATTKPKTNKKSKNKTSTSGGAADSSADSWKYANATWYFSYPECCPNNPNYNPKADKTECTDYSGCKWSGQFTGVQGKLSYDEVVSRNIVDFYSAKDQKKQKRDMSWWHQNVKGRKIEIKNPDDGSVTVVEPLDSCGDWDCNGCCTKNAMAGGVGTLIDLEYNTAKRFWKGSPKNAKIQWRFVS